MYKLLLCWRYLRTRWIALASIISVMLGVATMIVVNSVMAGFTHEMQSRIHGILSDLVFESHSLEGFHDPAWHMQEIRRVAGQHIEGMTATVAVPAMLSFQVRGQWVTRQIMLIGIDCQTHAQVSDFGQFLQHPENRRQLTFDLRDGGYDMRDHQIGDEAPLRAGMKHAGWPHRRERAQREQAWLDAMNRQQPPPADERAEPSEQPAGPDDPFAKRQKEQQTFNPATEQHTGIVLGIALASVRDHDGTDRFLVLPGDDVKVTFPTAGTPPKVVSSTFTIVDFYESKMSEYDSNFVFVPIETLQNDRGMIEPATGIGNVTAIQIKLKPGVEPEMVRDLLRQARLPIAANSQTAAAPLVFPSEFYGIYTWRDKQGPLLAAVEMESAVLNILLFLIIAVAGFGILAIFFMIVVEKTRDIGILKSLGASGSGILGIFLSYGLSLGIVGSGVGMVLGLLFVRYINQVRAGLEWVTGQQVFDPSIYYFYQIPTIVEPFTVGWIVIGALVIAVSASVLPACRAARLHPVEALRYE